MNLRELELRVELRRLEMEERFLQIASGPQEECERIKANAAALEGTIAQFMEFMGFFQQLVNGSGGPQQEQDQEPADEELPLCARCANPCSQMSNKVETCRRFGEYTDQCPSCDFWEGACMSSIPCVGGEHYVPKSDEEIPGTPKLPV